MSRDKLMETKTILAVDDTAKENGRNQTRSK